MENLSLTTCELSDSIYSTVKSLQNLCLNYIADNIERYFITLADDGSGKVEVCWYVENFLLCHLLSDELLQLLFDKKKVSESVLALFSARNVQLKMAKFQLYNEMRFTTEGCFSQLGEHRLKEINISGGYTLDMVHILNQISSINLLKLHLCPFYNDESHGKPSMLLDEILRFANVIDLDVSDVAVQDVDLKVLAEGMQRLQKLNISRTHVTSIEPLRPLANQLKALLLSDVHFNDFAETCETLRCFKQLQQLDISVSDLFGESYFVVNNLIQHESEWPQLVSLDISGTGRLHSISEELLTRFIETHSELQYLGLAATEACKYPTIVSLTEQPHSTLKIAGVATENQIKTCLRVYASARRPRFVHSSLSALFQFLRQDEMCTSSVLECVLPAMRNHLQSLEVQVAATACIYYITTYEQNKSLHPSLMADVVSTILLCMNRALAATPREKQLLRNCLYVMCSDHILDHVRFDYYACSDLLLQALHVDDPTVVKITSNLIGILAGKIPSGENAKLVVKHDCVPLIFILIHKKLVAQQGDVTLKTLLTAIWNLTDECVETCELVVEHGGVPLMLQLLQVATSLPDSVIFRSITLGLINNLAEVKSVHEELIETPSFIDTMRECCHSAELELSYFAVGTIANLVRDCALDANCGTVPVSTLLHEVKQAVESWKEPGLAGPSDDVIVGYRTFRPFIVLINCHDKEPVQQWALWAVQYVTTKNTERYRPLMARDGDLFKTLDALSTNAQSSDVIRQQAAAILKTYVTVT